MVWIVLFSCIWSETKMEDFFFWHRYVFPHPLLSASHILGKKSWKKEFPFTIELIEALAENQLTKYKQDYSIPAHWFFFFLLNVSIPYLLNFNILIVNLKIRSFSPLTLFFFFSELLCLYSAFHVYVKLRINSSKPAFKNSCLNFGLDFMNLFNSLH